MGTPFGPGHELEKSWPQSKYQTTLNMLPHEPVMFALSLFGYCAGSDLALSLTVAPSPQPLQALPWCGAAPWDKRGHDRCSAQAEVCLGWSRETARVPGSFNLLPPPCSKSKQMCGTLHEQSLSFLQYCCSPTGFQTS